MAINGPLVASIKISKFIRWIYLPLIKIHAKVTKQEPDMEKVMTVVEKYTIITLHKG